MVWDESVLEKPESLALEGLGAVRSSKAARLKLIKPGYFNPPGGRPMGVPGLHRLALLLLGRGGPPCLAAMQWWTTRGLFAMDRRSQEQHLLQQCAAAWGRRVLHVFARGEAFAPWLGCLLDQQLRWLVRWPKGHHLTDASCPLACESPRLWLWETRSKLLLMASLTYAFLLSLLDDVVAPVRAWRLSLLVPPHRQAEPNGLGSAVSPAHGPEPLMAHLPPGPPELAAPKFGMTHEGAGNKASDHRRNVLHCQRLQPCVTANPCQSRWRPKRP